MFRLSRNAVPLMLRIREYIFPGRDQISSCWEVMFFLILLGLGSIAAKNITYQRDPITSLVEGGIFLFTSTVFFSSFYCDQREQ